LSSSNTAKLNIHNAGNNLVINYLTELTKLLHI